MIAKEVSSSATTAITARTPATMDTTESSFLHFTSISTHGLKFVIVTKAGRSAVKCKLNGGGEEIVIPTINMHAILHL